MTKVFVASSREGLAEALAIQENLEQYADVVVWHQEVFDLSSYPLDALRKAASAAEYGVFVLTPDDFRQSRGKRANVPRDNVILELGLFIGVLGRHRSFVVVPSELEGLCLPTDLEGLVQARYKRDRDDLNVSAALGPACNKIRRSIDAIESESNRTGSSGDRAPSALAPERGGGKPGSFVHQDGRVAPLYTGQFLRGARREICILGFSLRSFVGYFDSRPEAEIKGPIAEALRTGVRVSWLFLDPDCAAAKAFAKARSDKRMLADIKRTILRATELKRELPAHLGRSTLELRSYAQLPFAHIKRVDGNTGAGRIMCLPYLPGLGRADTPYLEVRRNTNPLLFKAYSNALDHVLATSRRLPV